MAYPSFASPEIALGSPRRYRSNGAFGVTSERSYSMMAERTLFGVSPSLNTLANFSRQLGSSDRCWVASSQDEAITLGFFIKLSTCVSSDSYLPPQPSLYR